MSFPTTSIKDTLTGADQNPAPGWSAHPDRASGVQRAGNVGKAITANASFGGVLSAGPFGADQEAYLEAVTFTTGAVPLHVTLCQQNLTAGNVDGYFIELIKAAGADTIKFWRIDNSVYTQLGADVSQEAETWFGASRVGSTLTVYTGTGPTTFTQRATRTDGTYAGGAIGAGGFANAGNTEPTFRNFGGGTVVVDAPFMLRESTVRGGDVLRGLETGGLVEADGASAGVATVSGVSGAIKVSAGSAAGVATPDGISGAIKQSEADADGAATPSGSDAAIVQAGGDSDGVASLSGPAAAITSTEADSDGLATVAGVGEDAAGGSSTGSASGASTVSGEAAAITPSEADADGVASVSGPAAAVNQAEGSSSGIATMSGAAGALRAAEADSDGQAVISGSTAALAQTSAHTAGAATVNGVGENAQGGVRRIMEVSVRMVAVRAVACAMPARLARSSGVPATLARSSDMAVSLARASRMATAIERMTIVATM